MPDFTKDNGQHVVIDRNLADEKGADKEGWGIFLFDGKQAPLYADMVNIQSEYDKYFK